MGSEDHSNKNGFRGPFVKLIGHRPHCPLLLRDPPWECLGLNFDCCRRLLHILGSHFADRARTPPHLWPNLDLFLLPLSLLVLLLWLWLVGAGRKVGHAPALSHPPPVLAGPPVSVVGPLGSRIASSSGKGAGLRWQPEVGRRQGCEQEVLPGEGGLSRVVGVRVELLLPIHLPATAGPIVGSIEGLASSGRLEERRGWRVDSWVGVCPPPLPLASFLPCTTLPHSLTAVAVRHTSFACAASLHLLHPSSVILPRPQSGLLLPRPAWCFVLWRKVRLTPAKKWRLITLLDFTCWSQEVAESPPDSPSSATALSTACPSLLPLVCPTRLQPPWADPPPSGPPLSGRCSTSAAACTPLSTPALPCSSLHLWPSLCSSPSPARASKQTTDSSWLPASSWPGMCSSSEHSSSFAVPSSSLPLLLCRNLPQELSTSPFVPLGLSPLPSHFPSTSLSLFVARPSIFSADDSPHSNPSPSLTTRSSSVWQSSVSAAPASLPPPSFYSLWGQMTSSSRGCYTSPCWRASPCRGISPPPPSPATDWLKCPRRTLSHLSQAPPPHIIILATALVAPKRNNAKDPQQGAPPPDLHQTSWTPPPNVSEAKIIYMYIFTKRVCGRK